VSPASLSGVGIWNTGLRFGDQGAAAEAVGELEELGYTAAWIPDVGGPVFDAVENLLAASTRIVVATGILNIWMHAPADVAASVAALTVKHGDRFLLGLGVSHAPVVEGSGQKYRRPLAAMVEFLDGLDAAPEPVPVGNRALAALGPKMLDLAATRSGGVHPYLVTPEHTRLARAALGPDSLVLPEQTVILCSDADEAHAIGGTWLRHYLDLPNYANNLLRLGFTPDELAEPADRLFDAMIAWGDEEAVRRRVDEHREAGADHVCLQVLTADQRKLPREEWRRLAAALI
jgi:probable F420-dependent oxidoreductase